MPNNPTSTSRARAAMGVSPDAEAGKELTPVERRVAKIRTMEAAFADAVASGLSPQTLVRDAITAVRNVPELADTEESTFWGALMTAAQLGLRPNVSSLGHGWILPRRNSRKNRLEAVWQLGYQGMVELGYRSGLVVKITAHTIYAGEPHRIRFGTDDVLEHEPIQAIGERGEQLWHYACVWLNTGGVVWNAITNDEAQQIMRAFGAKDRNNNTVGPWRDNYEAMARKTALRGLWRYMPKTPALALALDTDEAVREGLEKDPALSVDVPESEPTTVTRADTPPEAEQAPPSAAKASEPVDVEPEPDAQPDPIPPPVHVMADGTEREAFESNVARAAYSIRIAELFGGDQAYIVTEVIGEEVPLEYLSTAELRAVADYKPDA